MMRTVIESDAPGRAESAGWGIGRNHSVPSGKMTQSDERRFEDTRWAVLVAQLLHSADLQILEAFGRIREPLSINDLFQVLDEKLSVRAIMHRLKRLRAWKAIRVVGHSAQQDPLEVYYCLPPLEGEDER